jgi:hypothetical protein
MLTRWLESRKEGLGATWRSTDDLEGRLPWMGHQGTPSFAVGAHPLDKLFEQRQHRARWKGASMQKTLVRFVGAALLVAAGCGRESAAPTESAFKKAESTIIISPVIPLPIPGGDYLPAFGHHLAGTIHQFVPGPVANGLDGIWAEPNGITNFIGTVAQVYMGGTAIDNHGKTYRVDVDSRVYQGEYIDAEGRHGRGTFCEI